MPAHKAFYAAHTYAAQIYKFINSVEYLAQLSCLDVCLLSLIRQLLLRVAKRETPLRNNQPSKRAHLHW